MPEIASRSPSPNDPATGDIGQEHGPHPDNQAWTSMLDEQLYDLSAKGPPPHDTAAARKAEAARKLDEKEAALRAKLYLRKLEKLFSQVPHNRN
jgi:hypothetical protein